MDIKRFLLFFAIAILLVAGLTACVRSLTPSGTVTPGELASGGETPAGTEDIMQQIWMLATQTALAQQGQTTPQMTATPVVIGEQPTPGATLTTPNGEPTAVQPTSVPSTQAPTPTFVAVPTATPGIPSTYTLQSGEFPFCIARRFNVDPGELLSLNGLSQNSTFSPGITLKIPQTGHPFPGNRTLRAHPATHTVTSGETIYSIACEYGDVDPSAIAYANGLTAPYKLTPGQTLQIP